MNVTVPDDTDKISLLQMFKISETHFMTGVGKVDGINIPSYLFPAIQGSIF